MPAGTFVIVLVVKTKNVVAAAMVAVTAVAATKMTLNNHSQKH